MKLPANQTKYAFIDSEMRLLKRNETNLHHAFWERASYSNRLDKIYRNLSGLVLPMVISSHGDLHANVRPPYKPGIELMNAAVDFNRRMLDPSDSPYHNFDQMLGFFKETAETSPNVRQAEESWKIASNMTIQAAFIEKGMVTPL